MAGAETVCDDMSRTCWKRKHETPCNDVPVSRAVIVDRPEVGDRIALIIGLFQPASFV